MDKRNIYFNNSILSIDHFNNQNDYKNKGFYEYTDSEITEGFISDFLNANNYKIVILSQNIEEAFNSLSNSFIHIEAAGGLVINEFNDLLIIFRRGKYDLPKGKCEEGESIEESAIREVEEECGIKGLSIKHKLSPTYHIYPYKGKYALKTTYWFKMQTHQQDAKPQYEEDIERAEWANKNDLISFKRNTYPTLLELLEKSGF